ncbi:hypothetical protein J2785_000169 [Burkholderia ambifaria]|nr:hypothetical protein [Burkholderia ambifaria]
MDRRHAGLFPQHALDEFRIRIEIGRDDDEIGINAVNVLLGFEGRA